MWRMLIYALVKTGQLKLKMLFRVVMRGLRFSPIERHSKLALGATKK